MDNSRHATMDGGKFRRPQLYTKNCKKLKTAESRKSSLSQGKEYQLVIWYQIRVSLMVRISHWYLLWPWHLHLFFSEPPCVRLPFSSLTTCHQAHFSHLTFTKRAQAILPLLFLFWQIVIQLSLIIHAINNLDTTFDYKTARHCSNGDLSMHGFRYS